MILLIINGNNNINDVVISYCIIVSEIAWLASQFATQNCFVCYSKLNLGSKFYAEVATHFPHKIKNTIYILNIIL